MADLDLEKFLYRVNHDRLLAAVPGRVADNRMLKLIRAFLRAGVMEDELVIPVYEGTPQENVSMKGLLAIVGLLTLLSANIQIVALSESSRPASRVIRVLCL